MPYKVKKISENKVCVYKKDTNEKVGCTTPKNIKKYLAALEVNEPKNVKKYDVSKFNYIQNIAENREEATILLYKPIGKYMDGDGYIVDGVSGDKFAQEILFLQDKVKRINVRINSSGGSVIEGMSIVQAIKSSRVPVVCYNDFFAASIASLILASGYKRVGNKHSVVMIHNPSAERELSAAEEQCLELFRKSISIILSTNSILSQEEVENLMKDETYFDAEEALEYGFIDEIVSEVENEEYDYKNDNQFEQEYIMNIMNKLSNKKSIKNSKSEPVGSDKDRTKLGEESPVSLTNEDDSEKAAKEKKSGKTESEKETKLIGDDDDSEMYDDSDMSEETEEEAEEQLSPGIHERIKKYLGMPDDSSDEEMCDAVKCLMDDHKKLMSEHDEAKEKLIAIGEEAKKAHKTKIDAMVNKAVTEKLIDASEVTSFTNLANADYKATKLMLEKLRNKVSDIDSRVRKSYSITDYISKNVETIENTTEFTLEDYWKRAPKKLEEIMQNNPEFYNKLVNDYNNKPKAWK